MKDNEKIRVSAPINQRVLKYAVLAILAAVLSYILIAQPQQIMNFVNGATAIFTPVIIGLCVAYIVNLILSPLERFWLWIWRNRKNQRVVNAVKRPLCLILAFLIFLSAIATMVFMVIPGIKDTISTFTDKKYSISENEWYKNTVTFLEKYYFDEQEKEDAANQGENAVDTDTKDDKDSAHDKQNSNEEAKDNDIILDALVNSWSKVLNTTVAVTKTVVTAIVNTVLGIAIAVYLLAQKEKFKGQFGRAINALFEPTRAKKVKEIASLTNKTFTKFIVGQLVEACILGTLCFIGMLIFKMPNAGIVSVVVAVTALIPVFGSFIGAGVGALLILFISPIKAIWFVIYLIVLQQFESNVIYPRVVGKSVGLPSVWVLIAVTIGGRIFGVPGMLFSVPICTVIYILFKRYVNEKNKQNELLKAETLQEEETNE